MLVNLKRLYVRMRSFPQARFVADLLLAVDPSAVSELRDRGLLAYHLQDFGAALRDLESYLRLLPRQIDEPMASEIPGEPADDLPDGENGNESTAGVGAHQEPAQARRRLQLTPPAALQCRAFPAHRSIGSRLPTHPEVCLQGV